MSQGIGGLGPDPRRLRGPVPDTDLMTVTEPAAPSPITSASTPGAPSRTRMVAAVVLGVAAGLALAIVFLYCLIPVPATDFWWQVKTGEMILQNGAIPYRDPFSWTAHGQPWMVHEWLTCILFAAVFHHLPHLWLVFYKAGLAAFATGLVMVRAARRGGSLGLAIGIGLWTGYLVRTYTDLRPQMLTFVFLALLLLGLDEYRAGRLRRFPVLLPLMFLVWANLHGGVVVGLLLLLLWIAGEAVGQLLFRDRSPGLKHLALGAAAAALAIACNPNGFLIYTYPFQVLRHPQVMEIIMEWWSPDFHHEYLRPFEVLLLGTLGILALRRPRREEETGNPELAEPLRMGEVLVILGLAHAALLSQRNMVPFTLAAAPVLAGGLMTLWRSALPLERLRLWSATPTAQLAGGLCLVAGLTAAVPAALPREPNRTTRGTHLIPLAQWFDYTTNAGLFPRAAADLLQRGYWPGLFFNDYEWGGYLLWRLYPQRKIFSDGRAEVYYGTQAFDDQIAIQKVTRECPVALDRWRVQTIITNGQGDLGRALAKSPRWRLVFAGPIEVVYVRAKPLPADTAR